MSEFAPPGIVGDDVANPAATALSAEEIDAVLGDFRGWLEQLPGIGMPPNEPVPVDLYTLLAHFTALRQEVNLQTRTTRAQVELQAQTLDQLRQKVQQPVSEPLPIEAESIVRPFVATLIDIADVQFLAARELERVVTHVEQLLSDFECAQATALPEQPSLGWLAKLCGAGRVVEHQERLIETLQSRLAGLAPGDVQPLETAAKSMRAALTGLQMGLQRLDRALQNHGIEIIPAAGRRFDPEQMEVVEGVASADRASGDVIDELRRGYRWNGRVFRYAQVRVAR